MGRMKERLSIPELEPDLSSLTEADLTVAASLFILVFQSHDTAFHCSETASLYQNTPPPGSWTPRSPLTCIIYCGMVACDLAIKDTAAPASLSWALPLRELATILSRGPGLKMERVRSMY